MARCDAGGDCFATCRDGCACIGDIDGNCYCVCFRDTIQTQIVRVGGPNIQVKTVRLKTFKPRSKVTPQSKISICTHNFPIGNLAQLLDKFLPNKIVVPANIATNRVTLSLKNRPLSRILVDSGLKLVNI